MTNNPSPLGASSQTTADPELERLLCDAYENAPVPRSLLQRIDRGVQEEWGVSPQLANDSPTRLSRTLAGVVRRAWWAQPLPVAATLSLLVVLGVIFNANSAGYAWANMVEAIVERGVLQVEDAAGVRWVSLSEGVIVEQTAEASQLVDVHRHVVLTRKKGGNSIQRFRASNRQSPVDRDRMLISFLLGEASILQDSQRLQGLQLVNESWERESNAGRETIALRVTFQTDAESIELQLQLDPESQLPRRCEVIGAKMTAKTLALNYPDANLQEVREREFPAGLAVLDVDEPSGRVATGVDPMDLSAVAPVTPEPDRNVLETSAAILGSKDNPDSVATASSLLVATTKWSPVTVTGLSDEQVVDQVNVILEDLWQANGVEPTVPADDEELLRRVYLDLAGRTPSVNEVRAYLKDESADRYEVLVDRLLHSPDHASHLATVWRTFLIPEGVDLSAFGGVAAFDEWLAARFANHDPYDEVVRSLLLAEGRLSKSGPLLFYSAVKLDPDQLASRTARVFLGMRLECAQCHDHPFEPWTQEDFWGYAAFFAQISRPQGELANVSRVMRVQDIDRGEVMLPESETVVPPRLLDGTPFDENKQASVRRQQLAQWLTSAENPYFARAAANRVWGHLFGKGIIDPVDDFGLQHPPTSPELLDLLAGHFIQTGFDLREMFRIIALSKAYRLSSGAATLDESRLELFAQMNVKTLTAEQVYDCIRVATLLEAAPTANPFDFNVSRFGNSDRQAFLQQFRTPAGRTTEYLGGIPQALTLMNGMLINGATGLSSSGLLKSLEAPFFTNEQRIEVLYFATLARRPRASEWELLNDYIPEGAGGVALQEGLADLLWALLNSAEFTMNH